MLQVLASNGIHPVLEALLPEIERATGCTVGVDYSTANDIAGRIRGGARADVAIVTEPVMEELAQQAIFEPASLRRLCQSGVGIAVRSGAPKPDISTVDTLKRTLLSAKSIAYTSAGASGIYFGKLLETLGIATEVNAKATRPAGGLIGGLAAEGTVELAIQQIPELMTVKGIDLVGPLPPAVQNLTVLAGGVFAASSRKTAAGTFLQQLKTPAAAALCRANGIDPL